MRRDASGALAERFVAHDRYLRCVRRQTEAELTTITAMRAAKIKSILKAMHPAQREHWLQSSEAIAALGAKNARDALRQARKAARKVTAMACSMAWIDAYLYASEPPPYQRQTVRPHAVRMQLSQGTSRVGEEAEPTRRWTPPQAVDGEDTLDLMTPGEARRFTDDHPEQRSPSGIAIYAIGVLGLRLEETTLEDESISAIRREISRESFHPYR